MSEKQVIYEGQVWQYKRSDRQVKVVKVNMTLKGLVTIVTEAHNYERRQKRSCVAERNFRKDYKFISDAPSSVQA